MNTAPENNAGETPQKAAHFIMSKKHNMRSKLMKICTSDDAIVYLVADV